MRIACCQSLSWSPHEAWSRAHQLIGWPGQGGSPASLAERNNAQSGGEHGLSRNTFPSLLQKWLVLPQRGKFGANLAQRGHALAQRIPSPPRIQWTAEAWSALQCDTAPLLPRLQGHSGGEVRACGQGAAPFPMPAASVGKHDDHPTAGPRNTCGFAALFSRTYFTRAAGCFGESLEPCGRPSGGTEGA